MSVGDSETLSTFSGSSSHRVLVAGSSFSVTVPVRTSNEEESTNSEKDSEGTFVGDANPPQAQNDAAKNRNTEPNPTPVDDDTLKVDMPQRGRSLKKENTAGSRHRGSSPKIYTANANVTKARRSFLGRRRKLTPYPPLKNYHNKVED